MEKDIEQNILESERVLDLVSKIENELKDYFGNDTDLPVVKLKAYSNNKFFVHILYKDCSYDTLISFLALTEIKDIIYIVYDIMDNFVINFNKDWHKKYKGNKDETC